MADTLRDVFNELSEIKQASAVLGKVALPHLTEAAEEALLAALDANDGEKFTYTALDHSQYLKMQKAGPETYGLEAATALMKKALVQEDFNMSVLAPFVAGVDLKSAAGITDGARLAALAEKHGFKALGALLA